MSKECLPSFTTVIPCHACAETIVRCLTSILHAARSGNAQVNVILVCSSSDDNATAVTCKAFADVYEQIRVIETPDRDASIRRNLGAEEAQTTHLIFTDPDCIATEDWFDGWRAAISSGARCATGRVSALSGAYQTGLRENQWSRWYRPGLWNRALPFRAGSSNNLMVEKRLFDALGGFCDELGPGTDWPTAEDSEFLYRVLRWNEPVRYEAGAHVQHDHEDTPALFLKKKEAYAHGLHAFQLGMYPHDPASWLGLLIGVMWSCAWLVAGWAIQGPIRSRQAWAEIKGRWRGVRDARRLRRSLHG